MLGYLLFAITLLILVLVLKNCSQTSKAVEEELQTVAKEKTRYEIAIEYYNMRMSVYVENNFKNFVRWEYVRGNANPKMLGTNEIRVFYRDGSIECYVVSSNDVWDTTKQLVFEEEHEPVEPQKSFAEEWLEQHLPDIEQQIKEKMASEIGVCIKYPIEEDADRKNEVKELLMYYTPYDVSIKRDELIINFQNILE